jgi:hypothetical protein
MFKFFTFFSVLFMQYRVIDIPEEQSNNSTESGEEESEEEGEEGVDPSEEALIQAFGETAVQGVTWLVHAMGLNLNQSNNTGTITASNGVTGQQQPTPASV